MFTGNLFEMDTLRLVLTIAGIVFGIALVFALLMLVLYTCRGKKLRDAERANCVWEGPGVLIFGIRDPYSWYYIDRNYVTGEYGIFSKTTTKIMLSRVTATQLHRTALGILFDYGTIEFVTLGNDVPNLLMTVKHPNEVLQALGPLQYPTRQNPSRPRAGNGQYRQGNQNRSQHRHQKHATQRTQQNKM